MDGCITVSAKGGILIKFSGNFANGPRNISFHFGDVPDSEGTVSELSSSKHKRNPCMYRYYTSCAGYSQIQQDRMLEHLLPPT